jgi:hypothetical protein
LALLAGRLLAATAIPATGPLLAHERFEWRSSLVRLVIAITIFDVVALATLQVVRESKARRRSLTSFAGKVAELAPGNQPLPADSSIRVHDRMVLAYRFRRPIPRQAAAEPGLPYLVPAVARLGAWCAGANLLAESGQAANDFALMRAPVAGTGRRALELCRAAEPLAGSGGTSLPGSQPVAGSHPRLLLPLGDPSPAPTP